MPEQLKSVPNHEKKAFKDMTPEERSAIVEAKLRGNVQLLGIDGDWHVADSDCIVFNYEYRTYTHQIVIPWDTLNKNIIRVVLNEAGSLWGMTKYEGELYQLNNILNIDTTGVDECVFERPI